MTVPLVLLSGVGADCRMFERAAAHLDGIEVIAWDMPGYGGKPLSGPLTFAGMADALVAELDRRGIGKAVLLGHSIGGMIAQEVWARHPDRVAGLILSGTTSAFGSRDGSFQEAFLKARLTPLNAGMSMAELAKAFAADLLGSAPDPAAGPTATRLMSELPEESYRAGLACLVTFDRRAEMERIAVPTLLIAGEEDTNAPLKTMTRMAEKIPGARLQVLERTGHLAPLECPERFAEVVRGFLATIREDAR